MEKKDFPTGPPSAPGAASAPPPLGQNDPTAYQPAPPPSYQESQQHAIAGAAAYPPGGPGGPAPGGAFNPSRIFNTYSGPGHWIKKSKISQFSSYYVIIRKQKC